MDATNLFLNCKLVPVLNISDTDIAVDLISCLVDCGINAVEVTLRSPAGLPSIEIIANKFPEVLVGAGSVRNIQQLKLVKDCGSQFVVSPGFTPQLIDLAHKIEMPYIPGGCTATEVMQLMEYGYVLQKFFPAELSGGVAKLKALSAPLPEVQFMPTGGITNSLVTQYLGLDCVSCVGGSWFVPDSLLIAKDFNKISELTKAALELCHE
ncbi:MAG: bifunctional 4-hydroxy-2-oxoglutarate aldolase/2-dehydro-3-deoxy-phosphogluconate aldolase [Gammaproteobacteria bacterium]|nr:bifunctional 4-hydroxy-2-oxoglutarate aldolase/2-dehydro-3-deoxy-phosphogluconate aldolase [Gammaproteobacteria bacterium]MDD9895970.1 bifunctional 4-hydroxy-2-oxoglutarate aldolase/2-dehydro-3-deoxy-phosphogluconate aldolase [Gammaproteobacteria bacterium]MDD9959414.1 bifunctional 4-hydroxy-2-oxoglutarate aldolase/2-dehydro-3-deoxy-phosphogluconate aldolase [Gammaproteobacteria bacterium]